MPRKNQPRSRRTPRQARSTQLVADLLEAAIHVLEREGPHRFTTIRVAEVAGASIGSVYQYFPNKQAILHRLQLDEWARTGATVDAILAEDLAPRPRLRKLFRAFFQSEVDEAPLRLALAAAAPRYPAKPRCHRVVDDFMRVAAPHATAKQRRFAAQLLFATMTSLGKEMSERRPRDVRRWADAGADMVAMYLASL